MKELSIEEKAKAYDEAIERLRNAFYDNSGRMCEEYRKAVIKIIEPIFPQLKESEDEKIRKWIREELKSKYVVDNIVNDVMADKALAWLEERGEQNATELSNICEYSLETWIKIVDFVLTEHNGIGNYLDSYETKDTAEKLREKYKFDAASEEWDRVYRKGLDAGVNKGKAIALKEQKPADKVEPKFHKGEWITIKE